MPNLIIKAEPERDLYAVFSTVVDNFTWIGTRAELEAEPGPEYDTSPERMARVEATGSSALSGTYGYTDGGFLLHNMPAPLSECKWLPRRNLTTFLEALAADEGSTVDALTEELDD